MSSIGCVLCPGGAAPINPSALLTFADGTYTCSEVASALPTINDTKTCIQVQLMGTLTCCEETWTDVCDAYNDPCPLAGDGLCKNIETPVDPNELCVSITADCLDCDPCSSFRYTTCSDCTSNAGCYWCPGDGLCYSKPYAPYPDPLVSTSDSCGSAASDWVTTCTDDASGSAANVYSDPFYDSDSWAFRLVNVESVWKQGIAGNGIHIRINDEGVDASHPEFAGKFDINASCSDYLPAYEGASHGTACASIAAALGNNNECAVGIAPGATLSSCTYLGTTRQDVTFLIHALDQVDVSSNSYGVQGCSAINATSTSTRRDLQGECPFQTSSSNPPCSVCDFASEPLSDACTTAIIEYCYDPFIYERDAACQQYLDLFTTCYFRRLSNDMQAALSLGITQGRNGKGIVYVFASGNSNIDGSNGDFTPTCNSRYTISVGAVGKDGLHAMYSTPGACLLVSGPGGDFDTETNWYTAQVGNQCGESGVGTSFATPVVSGVVALMLEKNPDLTWRDVQGIFANTSQTVDASDDSWVTNAAGYSHSYKYGFGLVDAAAAVEAASTWVNFGPEQMTTATSGNVSLPILEDSSGIVTSTITVNGIMTIESVVVYLDVESSSRGNLEINLTSPAGTESILTPGGRPENTQLPSRQLWELMTVRAWGEQSDGDWTLTITDTKPGDVSSCVDLPLDDDTFDRQSLDCNAFYLAFVATGQYTAEEVCPQLPNSGNACCFCSGGQAASSITDQLVSWKIVVYGRDSAGNIAPTASPAPTDSPPESCLTEQAAYSECLPTTTGSSNCVLCVESGATSFLCSDYEAAVCEGLTNCASYCGDCTDELLAYMVCVTGCPISCNGGAVVAPSAEPITTQPVPTALPTDPDGPSSSREPTVEPVSRRPTTPPGNSPTRGTTPPPSNSGSRPTTTSAPGPTSSGSRMGAVATMMTTTATALLGAALAWAVVGGVERMLV